MQMTDAAQAMIDSREMNCGGAKHQSKWAFVVSHELWNAMDMPVIWWIASVVLITNQCSFGGFADELPLDWTHYCRNKLQSLSLDAYFDNGLRKACILFERAWYV